MYRYILLRNKKQIFSGNDRMIVKAWELSDHQNRSYQEQNDDKYQIVDQKKDNASFRQALS